MERLFVYLTELTGGGAYWIIFGILVACGLGFPLPEDVPLIASGYLIWDGTMGWWGALSATMGGVLIGDTILFYLGRNLGLRILEGRAQILFKPEKIRRTRAYFRKYGGKVVFFARFVAGFRAVAFFMAGAMKMPYRRFILLDGLAALISVPVWIVIGYGLGNYFGDQIGDILAKMKDFKTGFTALIVVIATIVITRGYLKYRKSKQAGQARARKKAAHAAKTAPR